jgi:hypothetical protein
MRKPNSNAKLKTLPEERQSAIAEYARSHSIDETMSWLRKDGLETSSGAVSLFLSWYRLQQRLAVNDSTVSSLLEDLKNNDPSLTNAQLEQAGQAFFSKLAIEQEDSLTWKRIQDGKAKLELIRLTRDRFEAQTCELFLKWYADKCAKDIAESNVSNADKIAALRQTYFADIEQLDKSGKVVIPE